MFRTAAATECDTLEKEVNAIEKREMMYIGTVIGALTIAAWLYWRQQPENPFADPIALVCVESGELIELDRSQVNNFPLRHPKTNRRTLLPFSVEGDKKVIVRRFRPILERLDDQEMNQHVDINTLEIKE